LLDRGVEVGGDDQPLAGGAVLGTQSLAQLRVEDVGLEVRQARLLDHLDLGRFRVDDGVGEEVEHVRQVLVQRSELLGALTE
jgi:hypothetical protein